MNDAQYTTALTGFECPGSARVRSLKLVREHLASCKSVYTSDVNSHSHDRPRIPDEHVHPQASDAEPQTLEESQRMLVQAHESISGNEHDPDRYITAARCCKQLGRLPEALDILRKGIARCAPSAPLYEYYIERLEKCNQTEEAMAATFRN